MNIAKQVHDTYNNTVKSAQKYFFDVSSTYAHDELTYRKPFYSSRDEHIRFILMYGDVNEKEVLESNLNDPSKLMWPTCNKIVDMGVIMDIMNLTILNMKDDIITLHSANIKKDGKHVEIDFHYSGTYSGMAWVWFHTMLSMALCKSHMYFYICKAFKCASLCDVWDEDENSGTCTFMFGGFEKNVDIKDKAKRMYNTTALEEFINECLTKESMRASKKK